MARHCPPHRELRRSREYGASSSHPFRGVRCPTSLQPCTGQWGTGVSSGSPQQHTKLAGSSHPRELHIESPYNLRKAGNCFRLSRVLTGCRPAPGRLPARRTGRMASPIAKTRWHARHRQRDRNGLKWLVRFHDGRRCPTLSTVLGITKQPRYRESPLLPCRVRKLWSSRRDVLVNPHHPPFNSSAQFSYGPRRTPGVSGTYLKYADYIGGAESQPWRGLFAGGR